jgi:hypothetical protein
MNTSPVRHAVLCCAVKARFVCFFCLGCVAIVLPFRASLHVLIERAMHPPTLSASRTSAPVCMRGLASPPEPPPTCFCSRSRAQTSWTSCNGHVSAALYPVAAAKFGEMSVLVEHKFEVSVCAVHSLGVAPALCVVAQNGKCIVLTTLAARAPPCCG